VGENVLLRQSSQILAQFFFLFENPQPDFQGPVSRTPSSNENKEGRRAGAARNPGKRTGQRFALPALPKLSPTSLF
jgi:hypothetical protein